MSSYTLTRMKDNLFFARLHYYPSRVDCFRFLREMQEMVEQASEDDKVYLVTDFREGMFTDIRMIKEAAKLTTHPKFGASIGFGGDTMKKIFGDIFAETAEQPDQIPPEMPKSATEAIALLEEVCPGITEGIDWQTFFV